MSQTASQYLNSLLAKYTPLDTEFNAARRHRQGIESRLDLRLGLHEMFETGSLRHGTGVSGYSDADYIACLKGARPTPDTALNNVKRELQARYTTTEIVIRRPAVVCRFNNGLETVEVVVAYPDEQGGYWIPDPTGGWMKTHPKDHNRYVGEVNRKHSGGAKKLARLAKTWKYTRSVPVSSCYLEMRAAKYADGETTFYLVADLYFYLRELERIELAAMNDPTGKGSRFTAYSSDTNKQYAMSKLATAVSRAEQAKDYDYGDRHERAVERLRMLFDQ